jgi:hypothetical protein
MAINAEQLNIRLTAETKDLRQELTKAEKRIKGFEAKSRRDLKNTTKSFDALGRAARTLGPILAAAFSVQTITSLTRSAAEIGKLADVAGTGVVEFQRFAVGAKTVGFEMDKTADIIKDMNDRIGDFVSTGGGPMKDFFENIAPAVGVTAQEFMKLSGPQALQLYVSSLEKANLNQAEMTFYMEALASDSTALLPLLRNNGTEMRKLGDEAQRAGRILDQDAVDAARDLEREAGELADTIKMALTEAILNNKEELMDVIEFITKTAIPAFSRLISALGEASRLYGVATGAASAYEGQGARTDPGVRAQDVAGANALGGGDVSAGMTGYIDPETNQWVEYGTPAANKPVPGVTAPMVLPEINVNRPGLDGSSGGSKSIEDAARAVEDLREKYRDLIGTLDEAVGRNNDYEDQQKLLNEALAKGAITQDQFNIGMEAAKAKFKEASFEASNLSSVMQTLQGGLENAFMSIIDGTDSAKDAFKKMAAEVIKELYRVLVVQQLVGQFKTGGGGIMGSLFSAFGARAGGGTVQAGSPTITGEHGRELFVPQVNGRVMTTAQTKQMMNGGGGGIQIIQNNTFGQGVSRAEINAMLPKIVETTKAAVFDAQRRSVGGRGYA